MDDDWNDDEGLCEGCGALCDADDLNSECLCETCAVEDDADWAPFGPDYDYGYDGDPGFADPGGSALRAATPGNPRNLPCPECGAPNRLTPADRARGYRCDPCADRAERGWDY